MLILKIRRLWNSDENCTAAAVGRSGEGPEWQIFTSGPPYLPEPPNSHFSCAINFHSLSESCVAMRMLASPCSVIKISAHVPARRYVDNIVHFGK